ncbi:Enoyl-CoA hydratase/isomerase [Haloterrigena turkmenica DSM 5511]|uniref:Enoyl-CoA hydratase/isomerase n=1 Tax=Haloterrigena turkmenica (strain ATCC 51198 / DSM 5511 / JCM 9101 / NCIMB 13204 / VKM B-1734 / 4k) TaxID=543526 RepID=D2RUQ1_HALTV|nr:enoyl-CoA hydratase/isomerase family protein [Haloterrigena turkmenica]ADB61223.1 Enoyl-CoA hydratase/isomerase [Haloterrigena turkmenica DSM 5511]
MDDDLDAARVAFDSETGVGTVTMNRPDALNALNDQLRADIIAGLQRLEAENEDADGVALRAVVLEGAGEKAFCAGADVGGFSEESAGASSERGHYEFIRNFPAPVIAKIDGYCLGGGLETALACDFRLASESSTLGFPEVNLGLLPGAGGVQYVTKLAGPAVAKELAMTGEYISAQRAADEGIINHVYDDDEFDEEVDAFVTDLAGQAPLAVQAIKDSAHMAVQSGLEEGLRYDNRLFRELLETEDHAEGAAAFDEDREPEFEGK